AALTEGPETMAGYRQGLADQFLILICKASILQPLRAGHPPHSRRQYTAVIKIPVHGFRRVISSSASKLNRGSAGRLNLPDLPCALSICIKQDPLAIMGPRWDLRSTWHRDQPAGAAPAGIDEPDLTLARCRGVECDFPAVGRPRGMERQ